jgi:hypothetical protein
MPKKGYKQTEDHKQKAKENHKGMIGKTHSDLTKIKMSIVAKGKKKSVEACLKMSKTRTGMRPSIETIEKMKLSHKGKHTGPNSNFWKGGISPENKIIRQSIEYRLWREAVFARDNWTCQKTGKRGCEIHPHHIQNFSDFPDLRFAIDNGITLSEEAHREFHKIYGQKNNTLEQIQKFCKSL